MGKEMRLNFRAFSALLAEENTDDRGVQAPQCSALGFDLSVAPDFSFSALSPRRWQCLAVLLSSLFIKAAAKHVLVCHLLQVEKGQKWR